MAREKGGEKGIKIQVPPPAPKKKGWGPLKTKGKNLRMRKVSWSLSKDIREKKISDLSKKIHTLRRGIAKKNQSLLVATTNDDNHVTRQREGATDRNQMK